MKSLKSILCSEPWIWDSDGQCQISFNSNGTGALTCRSEFSLYIAAELDWELTPGPTAASPTSSPTPSIAPAAIFLDPDCGPTTLVTLSLKITLTKRRLARFADGKRELNEDYLHDSAFKPRIFHVRLERGDFIPTADANHYKSAGRAVPGHTLRYGLKLVFDPPPYPPAEDWKDPTNGPVTLRVWDFNEFCADKRGTVADRDSWAGRILRSLTEKA
ncbi:hypothetical protein F5Y14DRAFT_259111 [Nemania sp. NC0429]|nr:hypothetical protein F5Y14DRAFT_259111 [Nemania sp. NC0429]